MTYICVRLFRCDGARYCVYTYDLPVPIPIPIPIPVPVPLPVPVPVTMPMSGTEKVDMTFDHDF